MDDLRRRARRAYELGRWNVRLKLISFALPLVLLAVALRSPWPLLLAMLLIPARRVLRTLPRAAVPVNVVVCVAIFAGFGGC
jgi:hypothetical protein